MPIDHGIGALVGLATTAVIIVVALGALWLLGYMLR